MKPNDAFEAVQAIVGTVPEKQRVMLFELLSGEYGIGAIAVGVRRNTPETTSSYLESLLSVEQCAKMTRYREMISESWGINKEDLRLVAEDTNKGTKRVVLVDSSPNGQYKGSYQSIYENRDNLLKVDGRNMDILEGMTEGVYRAMIADAKDRGGSLPDSKKADRKSSGLWTGTMLTGEPLTVVGYVKVRNADDDGVYGVVCRPDADSRDLHVRAAVVIAEI